VSQKGTLFYLLTMFISFAPPKEMNQRKRVRKRQPQPVCPPATQSLVGATKQSEVRTFSGLPARISRELYIAKAEYTILLDRILLF